MDSWENTTALLVDDSPTIRRIIKNELVKMGFEEHKVLGAEDGQVALKLLGENQFDLIISDLNMPHMGGMALLHAVKAEPAYRDIPFVVITSETEENKMLEAFESGADQYITKPFEPFALELTLQQLFFGCDFYDDKTVLVIDDSHALRQAIVKNLVQAGFDNDNIILAGDGVEAFVKLRENKIDLIFSDWHVPKVGGEGFIKKLQESDALKSIPVFMATTGNQKDKFLKTMEDGFAEYIVKPFNALELQDKIRNIFPQ